MNTFEKLTLGTVFLSTVGCTKTDKALEIYNSHRGQMIEVISGVFDQIDSSANNADPALKTLRSDLELAARERKGGKDNSRDDINVNVKSYEIQRTFKLNENEGLLRITEGWDPNNDNDGSETYTGGARIDIALGDIQYEFSNYSPNKASVELNWERDFSAKGALSLYRDRSSDDIVTSSSQDFSYYPTVFDQYPEISNTTYSDPTNESGGFDEIDIGSNQDAEEIKLMLKAIETLKKIRPSTLN